MNPYNPENPASLPNKLSGSQSENPGQTSNPAQPETKESQFSPPLSQKREEARELPPEKGTGFIGGPQFEEMAGWGKKVSHWLSKYGSTVILPIIAILILVGGVYLYTSQRATEMALVEEEMPQITEEETAPEATEPSAAEKELPAAEELTITAEKGVIEEIIPQSERKIQAKVITKKAEPGEGVTHLARRALKDYLEEHPREDLSLEHKIYIEDYLQNRTGSQPLEIGDELSFSEDLIKEAIDASLNLTPNQLENLKQYSALVSW